MNPLKDSDDISIVHIDFNSAKLCQFTYLPKNDGGDAPRVG